jgi:hypothetical protein
MSNLKLTGGWAAAVIIVIVGCVTTLEGIALWQGIDGVQLVGVVGALLAFGGALFGFTAKGVLTK